MSVFCSNTLIFAPECWKCILRSPDFKIFQKLAPLRQVFSFSTYSKAFATYLKSYQQGHHEMSGVSLGWGEKSTLKIPYSSRLFTVLYFSVRSSTSSALRYGLPSCMSVKPPRYIWKSRSPQLMVRRTKSRRSHEKIGDCVQCNIQGVQIPITSPE